MDAEHRCRASRRRGRPAPEPLRGPEDALEVILASASQPPRPETICLLLDHAHRGGTVVVVEGAATDADLEALAGLLLCAAGQGGGPAAVVLATVRPGCSHLASAPDERCWFGLRERFDEAGVELLDWFILAGGVATSVAETTDSRWQWQREPG